MEEDLKSQVDSLICTQYLELPYPRRASTGSTSAARRDGK